MSQKRGRDGQTETRESIGLGWTRTPSTTRETQVIWKLHSRSAQSISTSPPSKKIKKFLKTAHFPNILVDQEATKKESLFA